MFSFSGIFSNNKDESDKHILSPKIQEKVPVQLPVEVYLAICLFLDNKTIFNFMLTSKSIYHFLVENEIRKKLVEQRLINHEYLKFYENNKLICDYESVCRGFYILDDQLKRTRPKFFFGDAMREINGVRITSSYNASNAYRCICYDKPKELFEVTFQSVKVGIYEWNYRFYMDKLILAGAGSDSRFDKGMLICQNDFGCIVYFMPSILNAKAIECFKSYIRIFYYLCRPADIAWDIDYEEIADWKYVKRYGVFRNECFNQLIDTIFTSKDLYFISLFIQLTMDHGNVDFMKVIINQCKNNNYKKRLFCRALNLIDVECDFFKPLTADLISIGYLNMNKKIVNAHRKLVDEGVVMLNEFSHGLFALSSEEMESQFDILTKTMNKIISIKKDKEQIKEDVVLEDNKIERKQGSGCRL